MAFIIMVLALALQSGTVAPADDGKDTFVVEQLPNPQRASPDLDIPDLPRSKSENPTSIRQLPEMLDAPVGKSKGEETLAPVKDTDRYRLAGEVARVAEMLRARGQQPTPDALAREIGPEALTEYLSVDPSMLDSYATPKDAHQPQSLPQEMIILPPVMPQ